MFIVKQKRKSAILPYAFTIEPDKSKNEYKEDVIPIVLKWIYDNIGEYDKKRWQMRHGMGDKKFLSLYFSNKEDATAFKLTWM